MESKEILNRGATYFDSSQLDPTCEMLLLDIFDDLKNNNLKNFKLRTSANTEHKRLTTRNRHQDNKVPWHTTRTRKSKPNCILYISFDFIFQEMKTFTVILYIYTWTHIRLYTNHILLECTIFIWFSPVLSFRFCCDYFFLGSKIKLIKTNPKYRKYDHNQHR